MRRRLLLAALVLNLGLVVSSALMLATHPAPRPASDFVAFYTGWSMVRAGDGPRLYDFSVQSQYQRRLLAGRTNADSLTPFINPPQTALLLAPLAWLSLRTAGWLWSLASLALLAWFIRDVVRERPPGERWLVAAAVVATPPVLWTFVLNAFSLIVLVSLWQAWRALEAGRDRTAGAWLALALFKPQLVMGPALAVLVRRRWGTVATLAAGTAVAVGTAALAFGPGIWPGYLRAVDLVHGGFERLGIDPGAMYNFKGTLFLAFGQRVRAAVPAVALGGWLAGLAITAWIWRGPWRPREPRFALQMAATLLVGGYFSLHLFPQDGLLLVGAALLFESYLRRAGRPRTLFAVVALVSPMLWFAIELAIEPTTLRFPVVLTLVLGAWMARELLRRQTSGLRRDQPAGATMQLS